MFEIGLICLWVGMCLTVAISGLSKRIGFWRVFLLSLIFSPLIGLIIGLVSPKKKIVISTISAKYINPVVVKIIVFFAFSPLWGLLIYLLYANYVSDENKEYRELLTKNGIEYEDKNLYKQTLAGNLDTVIMFLKAGKSANKRFNQAWADKPDDTGLTLTMLAAKYNHLDMVKYFIEQRHVNVNKKSYWGRENSTALLVAAEAGNTDIVKYLLSKGAKVNQRESWNHLTPLIYAAKNGHYEIVKLLLKHNADINIRTKSDWSDMPDVGEYQSGMTAIMYAAVNKHKDIVDLLLKYGAKVDEITFLLASAIFLVPFGKISDSWGQISFEKGCRYQPKREKRYDCANALIRIITR